MSHQTDADLEQALQCRRPGALAWLHTAVGWLAQGHGILGWRLEPGWYSVPADPVYTGSRRWTFRHGNGASVAIDLPHAGPLTVAVARKAIRGIASITGRGEEIIWDDLFGPCVGPGTFRPVPPPACRTVARGTFHVDLDDGAGLDLEVRQLESPRPAPEPPHAWWTASHANPDGSWTEIAGNDGPWEAVGRLLDDDRIVAKRVSLVRLGPVTQEFGPGAAP
jgi:hypothetical protein